MSCFVHLTDGEIDYDEPCSLASRLTGCIQISGRSNYCDSMWLSKDLLLIMLFQAEPDSQVAPPLYDSLDAICSTWTYRSCGQAKLITDLLAEHGLCTYSNAMQIKEKIAANLENKTFSILFQD